MLWCIGHDKRQTFPKLTRYTRPICWRSGRKLCLVGKITRLLWQIKSSRTKCNEQGSWAITCTNTYVRDRDFKKEYYYYLGSNRSFWNPGWYKTSSYLFLLFFFFFCHFLWRTTIEHDDLLPMGVWLLFWETKYCKTCPK